MQAPLHGVRVLDLGHYVAGPLATMLLAEQGADVVHVVPPDGERWRDPSNAYLQRNKEVVPLDLRSTEGRRSLARLGRDADVIVDNFRPGVRVRLGLGPESADDPRIRLGLPGFAPSDARARMRAWEGIIASCAGLYTDVHVARQFLGLPPVFTALRLASVYGAVHGAIAATAMLHKAKRSGRGAEVHVPLADAPFHAMGSLVMNVSSQPARYDIPPVPRLLRDLGMPLLRRLVAAGGIGGRTRAERFAAGLLPPLMDSYPCADGRLLYVFAMDHDAIPRRLTEALGIGEELANRGLVLAPLSDTSTVGRNICDAARLSRRLKQALREILARALARRPAREWERVLNDAGVPAAMQRTMAEWMDWEPVRRAGLMVEIEDPETGMTAMPGRSLCVGAEDAAPVLRPRRSARSEEVVSRWGATSTRRERQHAGPDSLPLANITVVDMSSMLAGPVAARVLAELGAEVWKIEPEAPRHGPRMTRWYGIEVNQGKRSVVLDARSPEGRRTVRAMLERSDVLVHNLRPDAARACGVDDDAVQPLARLIVASVAAYGGPSPAFFDTWPGYDPVLQASTGIMTRYGSVERPELHAIASCVDYLSGDLLAFGVLTALVARDARPSEAALRVRASLAQAAQLAQATLMVRGREGLPDVPEGQLADGWSPENRIYETKDGFIYVVLETDTLARLGVEAGSLVSWVRARPSADVVLAIGAAGGVGHAVRSLGESTFERVTPASSGANMGSLLTVATAHPAGSEVITVFPGYARATPPIVRPLSPATHRGEAQGELVARFGVASTTAASVEPYLPP